MSYDDQNYATVGIRHPTQRIIEQGDLMVATARAHEKELGAKFPKAKVDELAGLIGQIKDKTDAQTEGKFTKNTAGVPVWELIDRSKGWIRDGISAADNAFEEEPAIVDEFRKGGKLGHSVPKISARRRAKRKRRCVAPCRGLRGRAFVPWFAVVARRDRKLAPAGVHGILHS